MALTTAEVTAVSRNSGTRRIREDTQGHDQGANQAQENTGGAAGIRKDTTLGRFGTVRPRVQIPGPRPISSSKSPILDVIRSCRGTAGAQILGEPRIEVAKFVATVGRSELGRQGPGAGAQLYIS
jgi:hypothetical protein